jgi:hypothetical protein
MKNLNEKIKILCEQYNLDFNNFAFVKKNFFVKKKYFILYGINEYYFEVDKEKSTSKNYFPYFNFSKECDLENWISSIQIINIKKSRLLKSITEGKSSRDFFKEKFKV